MNECCPLQEEIKRIKELEEKSLESFHANIIAINISSVAFIKEDDSFKFLIENRFFINLNKNHPECPNVDLFHIGRKCRIFKLDEKKYHIEFCLSYDELEKIRNEIENKYSEF